MLRNGPRPLGTPDLVIRPQKQPMAKRVKVHPIGQPGI